MTRSPGITSASIFFPGTRSRSRFVFLSPWRFTSLAEMSLMRLLRLPYPTGGDRFRTGQERTASGICPLRVQSRARTARVRFEAAGFGASINFSPTCAGGYVDACFRAQPLRLDLVWYFLLSASDMQQTGHDPRLHPPVSRQCTDVAGITCVPRAS